MSNELQPHTVTSESQEHDYSMHEILDRAHTCLIMVDSLLLEHELLQERPVYLALAEEAQEALSKLYQLVGRAHL